MTTDIRAEIGQARTARTDEGREFDCAGVEKERREAEGAAPGLDAYLESVLAGGGDTTCDEKIRGAGPEGLTAGDRRRVSAILESAASRNTRLNYRYQWRRFASWTEERGAHTIPAEPTLVAAYIAERAEEHGHRPATLRAAAAAIGFVHRSAELPDPCDTEEVKGILSGVTRWMGSAQRQAEGMTEQALDAIVNTACLPRPGRGGYYENVDTARRRGETDIAMISLMRDAMLRVSEAADLRWADVTEKEDGTGRLLIRRSKTDAEGEGAVAFVSSQTMSRLALIRSGAEDESVFGLRRNQIARRIGRAAQEAGLGEGFSGHSPRVGMAQDLARAGTELPRLMTAGRWRSPRMPALYTRNETIARGAVAQYYGSRDVPAGGKITVPDEVNDGCSDAGELASVDNCIRDPAIITSLRQALYGSDGSGNGFKGSIKSLVNLLLPGVEIPYLRLWPPALYTSPCSSRLLQRFLLCPSHLDYTLCSLSLA